MNALINLNSPKLSYTGVSINNPHSSYIPEGVTALVGPNGSGKSSLSRILHRGWNFTTNSISSPRGKLRIARIEFSDIHTLTGFKASYYQQRYEATMNDDVPFVREIVGKAFDSSRARSIANRLNINPLLDKRANSLSSGELRKILLTHVLSGDLPDLLILDNPYIGLDPNARTVLDSALTALSEEGLNLLFCVCDPADIPQYADSVLTISGLTLGLPQKRAEARTSSLFSYAVNIDALPHPEGTARPDGESAVSLRDCTVAHNGRVILDNVNWEIRQGERWALCGPNGSGKTTLLSLILADHPQSYSNDVRIFGRKRGSGESIWDIKRLIGYISPEMHLYFGGQSSTVREIIARGLNDTVGNFTSITPQMFAKADSWISLLHLESISGRRFSTLSSGEQRMTLIARTMVKNAPLLILDEPMHGLDVTHKRALKSVINALAARDGITLVYVTHCPEERPECITHTLTLG